MSADTTSQGVSRRSIAVGVAWTVPTIVAATSAPSFAISEPTPTVAESAGCKAPGASCSPIQKGYAFPFHICNVDTVDIWIYSVNFLSTSPATIYTTVFNSGSQLVETLNNGAGPDVVATLPRKLAPGECVYYKYNGFSNNSANIAFTANLSFTWGHTSTAAGDTDHAPVPFSVLVSDTPPDCCK